MEYLSYPIAGFKEFFRAYLECLIWVLEPVNEHDTYISDIPDVEYMVLKAHALSFYSRVETIVLSKGYDVSQLGHDFALVQNRQDVGFLDRSEEEYGPFREHFTRLATKYPEITWEDLFYEE